MPLEFEFELAAIIKTILRQLCYVNAHADGQSKIAIKFDVRCYCSRLVFFEFSIDFSRSVLTANICVFTRINIKWTFLQLRQL